MIRLISISLIICLFQFGCGDSVNHQENGKSKSGKYSSIVSVVYEPDGRGYWRPKIFKDEKEIFIEKENIYVGQLNIYWGWDDADALWVYNSDNGFVYKYSILPGGVVRSTENVNVCPKWILPEYAK